jgi:glyoxylase-like metal-dependent hydrolase (beta-lactamase superfamily II)
MSKIYIRINGTGNAWPVLLGTDNAFYNRQQYSELSNASFSIIQASGLPFTRENIEWEVLIDAGHGIVQYLLQAQNRLPDAICLTHSHLDHTLSLDWIIQSYYKYHNNQEKIPLFAGRKGWDFVCQSFPQVESLADFSELKPGVCIEMDMAPGIRLTSFPVYHGERISGPTMLVFESASGSKAVFTGDVLCPLLRKADYRYIKGSKYLFTDANNRFPYPRSNHWSIIPEDPDGKKRSKYLEEWERDYSPAHLIGTHLTRQRDEHLHPYFDEFLAYAGQIPALSVFDFLSMNSFGQVILVHYGGMEDLKYHDQPVLNTAQLENWTNARAELYHLDARFIVPKVGDVFELT